MSQSSLAESPSFETLLCPEDVAQILNVKVSWVYYAAKAGQIPSVRAGRHLRFSPKAIQEWIASGGTSGD